MRKKLPLLWMVYLCSFSLFAQHYALKLNGVNNSISVDSTLGSEIRTIEFWFSPSIDYNTTNENSATFIFRDTPDQMEEFGIYIGPNGWEGQAGRIVFVRRIGEELHKVVSNQSSWNAGNWYHVSGVIHPVDGMQLFINGQKQIDTNTTVLSTTFSTQSLAIGAWNSNGLRPFVGQMDDLRLWYYERTAEEILTGMCHPVDPTTEGLFSYWNFNNNTDSLTMDMTPNGYDLRVENSNFIPTNQGLLFGQNEATINLDTTIGNGIRSISLWFKLLSPIDSTLSQPQALIYRNATPNIGEFGLYFGAFNWAGKEGRLTFTRALDGEFYSIVSDQNHWESHRWYQVLATIDPEAGMKLYINHTLQADQLLSVEATQNTNDIVSIGKWGDGNIRYFDGFIDDVLLWEKEMSIDQLSTALCDTLIVDNNTQLRAFFDLDENVGNLVENKLDSTSFVVNSDSSWLETRNCTMGFVDNTLPITTNTEELSSFQLKEVDVFPNPSRTSFMISLPQIIQGNWQANIYNSQGQLMQVHQGLTNTLIVEQHALPPGIYYLQISTEYQIFSTTKKLIIL